MDIVLNILEDVINVQLAGKIVKVTTNVNMFLKLNLEKIHLEVLNVKNVEKLKKTNITLNLNHLTHQNINHRLNIHIVIQITQ